MLEPVVRLSGKEKKPNSFVEKRIISEQNLFRVRKTLDKA
jgi:hypothetical protein